MEIYIEYAFLENFLFDGALLTLALTAAREKRRFFKISAAACVGAVFAIVYPLLRFSKYIGILVKILMGTLLVMLAFGRLKTKKEWGRYALTSVFFFCFSFGFGGTLLGVYSEFSIVRDKGFTTNKMPSFVVFILFLVLCAFSFFLIRKLYARRAVYRQIFPCKISAQNQTIEGAGFLDSGNLARKNGVPVCFVSPELIYDLYGMEIISGGGQVCDEMAITTVTGEKKVPLYAGEIELETGNIKIKKRVYFSPSANMIGREYTILLYAGLLEEGESYDAD